MPEQPGSEASDLEPMTGRWPLALAGVAVVAVAAVLFAVLSPDDGDEGGITATGGERQQPERAGEPGSGNSAGAHTEPAPAGSPGARTEPEPEIPEVVVRDGRPVGGAIEMEATRGERIVFDVRSDAAEEIHVHGYDITRVIAAGGTARVAFRADLEGVYEAELHGSGAPIAELTVKPG